jgi:DNA gyrase subunit B
LNVERARFDRMLSSQEVGTLITALGAGIGEEFSIEKLRYHKIIIMTDADVDGAHIRTLLLTFFYRQMPQIVDQGYLYIAQPPLYKVKRGSSEVYLKDAAAFERFIVEAALDSAVLRSESGVSYAGAELAEITQHANQFTRLCDSLSRLVDKQAIQAAALAGLCGAKPVAQDASLVATILNRSVDTRSQWSSRFVGSSRAIECVRRVRGVAETIVIPEMALISPEAEHLAGLSQSLSSVFASPLRFESKKETVQVASPLHYIEAVFEAGKKGASVSRFKGLGEMNAEQLWETTLDPDARTLLQVNVKQAEEADEVFSTLMGDVVEPRRDFIVSNALNVVNLDA